MRCLVFGLVILSVASLLRADEPKVPLKTEIPEEVLAGTPPDVLALLFPGLEELPEGEPPAFMVPKGTVNLALKKKVTASDTRPLIGKIEFVTDGRKSGDESAFVELPPQPQWVQIDLEKPAEIYAVYIWHYFREARSYHDVVIQVSDDPEFKKDVKTIYSNDQDNSLKLGLGKSRPYIETFRGKIFDAKGVQGRYVRVYSNGNTADGLNHYVEVEVFGKPAKSTKEKKS
jgi:hypothetical protein